MYLVPKEKYFILDYRPGSGMGNEELETIQAGMLELVMPVLPHRLSDDWRRVIEQMDFLDVPGMRAVRTGIEQGKRTSADTIEEQMEIVKRGKVSYLFERFVDELQIQTLFLLLRGGNLEVKAQMKYHVEKWGKARYGEKMWPHRVQDEVPALFIGMTGLDEEFRNREIYAEKLLYDTRLNSLLDTLGNVMTDFGGKGKAFTNVYPIRYTGTWDTDESQREKEDPEKWIRARKAFLESELVKMYVRDPAIRWDTAMRDGDGGQSLISVGIRAVTSADAKQDQLQKEIQEVQNRLLQLSRGWVVDPDTNIDREKRLIAARKVYEWLTSDEEMIYQRVHALEESLCVADGEELQVADCAETQTRRHGDPLPKQLKTFLHEWATVAVPKRWESFCNGHKEGEPWLDPNDLNTFTRYLRDYLLIDSVFETLVNQIQPVVTLKTRDEAARRRARRKYVRIILNDYVMNPGPSRAPIEPPASDKPKPGDGNEDFSRFGLMASFVQQWAKRMPLALALGAGEHIRLPPGNMELIHTLEPFEHK